MTQTISQKCCEINKCSCKSTTVISFPERCFVVGAHCSTDERTKRLKELLKNIVNKFENPFIILASHLPILDSEIYESIDYLVYNKNNPIINRDVYTSAQKQQLFSIFSYREGKETIISRSAPYQGYAQHLSMMDAFSLADYQRFKYIHYMNYDVSFDLLDQLDNHYDFLKDGYDLVHYLYGTEKEQYINTDAFSITTKCSTRLLLPCLSYDEYLKFSVSEYHFGLEPAYSKNLHSANKKNLGYFHKGLYRPIGTISFSNVKNAEDVSLLGSPVKGVTVIPYEYENITRIIISNSWAVSNEYTKQVIVAIFLDKDKNEMSKHPYEMSIGTWFELYPDSDVNYVKIWFDGSVNIFFDLKDKRNYGTFEVIK